MAIKMDRPTTLVFKNNIAFKTADSKSIKGQVQEKKVPLPCRVRLFERKSGLLMSEIATDSQGYYAFYNLSDEERFFVVAHHPEILFNAVIQDNVVPK
ncbi:carboxypeptidase regulatory-like domain-containing protein [Acinetobacter junii]|uniref:carboxypeptidase regulatory-like domain-containing protein n=1 Tax=Acinetobacter junii TaxID=40215 RepID=UPI00124D729C|nr:carboxypeptidase regulatory-like domain-containing protein [Acinetobacter junii]